MKPYFLKYTEKRFNPFGDYLKFKYKEKIGKIVLTGGLTCPNRDGKLSDKGCTFCNEKGGGEYFQEPETPISKQIEKGKKVMSRKYKVKKFIAYFQNFSNTYAPYEYLHKMYSQALEKKDIIGLAIATRPDCLEDIRTLEYLNEKAKDREIWIELGLQTIHQQTLKEINRGHSYNDFKSAVEKIQEKAPDVKISAHLIFGLPGEDIKMNIESAKEAGSLGIDGIKFHPLMVIKGTEIEELFNKGEYIPLSRYEYVNIVINCLRNLPERVLIQRLTSTSEWELLAAPEWIKKKFEVLNSIDYLLNERDIYQGDRFREESLIL